MKKKLLLVLSLCFSASLCGSAQSSVLKGVLGRGDVDNLGSIVRKITGKNKSEVSQGMNGKWIYFDSELLCKNDDYLAKAGGPLPLITIKRYTNTLFSRISINDGWTFSFNDDKRFIQRVRIAGEIIDLSGTYSFDRENLTITFSYEPKGRLKFGTVSAIYANKDDFLYILYSSDAFLKVLNKASQAGASYTSNAVITTLTAYLETYEGLLVGYKMKMAPESAR